MKIIFSKNNSSFVVTESDPTGMGIYIFENYPEGIQRPSCNEPLIYAVVHDHHIYKEEWITVVRFSHPINKRPGIMMYMVVTWEHTTIGHMSCKSVYFLQQAIYS